MKKTVQRHVSLLLAFVAFSAVALANATAATPAKIKLRVGDLQTYAALLASLDTCQKLIPSTEANRPPTVVRAPCEFTGTFRFAIATNLTRVQQQVQVYTQARNSLIASLTDGKRAIPKENTVALERFAAEDAKLRDAEVEIEIVPLDVSELRLDQNPIPAATIAGLHPFWIQ